MEALGFKKKREGYFGVTGTGSGAIMGAALGTSAATTAHAVANILGRDITDITGLSLPQLVAMSGALGAGIGSIYGSTVKE
jgi:hypothetical protein